MATNDQWMRDYTCDICHTAGVPVHQRNEEGWTCGPCYRNRIAELSAERDRYRDALERWLEPDGERNDGEHVYWCDMWLNEPCMCGADLIADTEVRS